MLRITIQNGTAVTNFILEGTLSGDWVDELERCWLETKATPDSEQFRVDLSGVQYIDDRGRQLLKRMFCDGADLQATGVMTRGIIEEIVLETDLSPPG